MSDILHHQNLNLRLSAIESGQRTTNTALGLILDALQVQRSLLQELVDLAGDEAEPSKLGQSLSELTFAVVTMGKNVEAAGATLAALPEQIGAEIDRVLVHVSPAAARPTDVAP